MQGVELRAVANAERDRAVEFLRQEGYAQAIQDEDRVFAAIRGPEVVAAVRLASEHGVTVLRGMRVRRDLQRQGVGRALVRHLVGALGTDACYCIAYRWLVTFYGAVGFQEVTPSEAPSFLAARHARYMQDGSAVVVMRRPDALA
jgi:predicted N-acetyltransferase YhbS